MQGSQQRRRWDGVTAEQRLREKFVINERTQCWEWTAGVRNNGYGAFWHEGRFWPAHRASLRVLGGIDVPAHLDVCHRCDNPRCVNPAHLFVGSRTANMQDASAKDRTSSGSHRPTSKLTPADVHRIRELARTGAARGWKSRIARELGVTNTIVCRVANGKSWRRECI